jgi:hypothetical protein
VSLKAGIGDMEERKFLTLPELGPRVTSASFNVVIEV